MKKGCIHGNSKMAWTQNGGRFCKICSNTRSKGVTALHDAKRNPVHSCIEHGPHYVIENWTGEEFCLMCGVGEDSLHKRCRDSNCLPCKKCHQCKRETKKNAKFDEIELITRPDYQEASGKLNEIENFTRIKNAAQG